MGDVRSRLAAAAKALARTDTRRTQEQAQRDALIREARDQGVSWDEVQALTGLSRQAVANVLRKR